MSANLLVSVSCVTFNQVKYIQACLDGFLIQQGDFDLEILIHDDASTDGTREIIEAYQKKYPAIIKPIYQQENQYSKGVRGFMARYNFTRASGKYLALCEGDDYWTSEHKLQKQLTFLEAHPEYALCFHKVDVEGGDDYMVLPQEHETITDLAAKGNYIRTPSVMFRTAYAHMPESHADSPLGDLFVYLYVAQFGKLKYLNESMAVYRKQVGSWSTQQQHTRIVNTIRSMEVIHDAINNLPDVQQILKGRVFGFLKKVIGELSTDDLARIQYSNFWKHEVEQYLLNEVKHWRKQAIQHTQSKTLIQELLRRSKTKWWKSKF